jgi:hypothetical protein
MIISHRKFVVSFFWAYCLFSANDQSTAKQCTWHFAWFNHKSMLTKKDLTFFCWIHNQLILFVLYEFVLLNCFQISLIFYAVSIFWSWYHLLTLNRDFANVSFNTRLRSVFIWRWIFSCKLSIVVRFLLYFLMTIFFEIFHIIVVCVRSTLKLRVDVVFRALRSIYSWFDCRNHWSTYDVRALLINL